MTPLAKAVTIIAAIHSMVKGKKDIKSTLHARTLIASIKMAIETGVTPRKLLQDISDEQLVAAGFNAGREALLNILEDGLEESLVRFKRKQEQRKKKSEKQIKQIKDRKEKKVCT